MKESFTTDKKMRLSIYSLPKIIYVKYSILAWFLVVLVNGLTIFFIYLLWSIRGITPDALVYYATILVFIILTIYIDTDVLHAIMKKQFIEISDKSIRIKKLTSDRTFNWSEIKLIEEMYSIRFHILNGVKLKKRDNDKSSLLEKNITINFNKFSDIEIEEFFEILYRKKSSAFRIKF